MNEATLIKLADAILEEPVLLELKTTEQRPIEQKRWEKLLGRKQKFEEVTVTVIHEIRPAFLSTMVKCSRILLGMRKPLIPEHDTLDWSYSMVDTEAIKLAELVATAIHNSKTEVPKSLIETVYNNYTAPQIQYVSNIVIAKLDLVAFINCMDSLREQMQILQKEEKPVVKEETTAFTAPSEV